MASQAWSGSHFGGSVALPGVQIGPHIIGAGAAIRALHRPRHSAVLSYDMQYAGFDGRGVVPVDPPDVAHAATYAVAKIAVSVFTLTPCTR